MKRPTRLSVWLGQLLLLLCISIAQPLATQAQRKPRATVDFASKFLAEHGTTANKLSCTTISPQMMQQIQEHNNTSRYKGLLAMAKSMRIVSVKDLDDRATYMEAIDQLLATHSSRFAHHLTEGAVSVYVRKKQGHIVEAVFVQRTEDVPLLFTVVTGQLTNEAILQLLAP